MNIIKKILTSPEFDENPLILFDIGASGEIYREWRKISKYSICVAFDPDERAFEYVNRESKKWRKFYSFNYLVGELDQVRVKFYLTKSPFCSSSLYPNTVELDKWAFHSLFEVKKTIEFETMSLTKVLEKIQIQKIDWIKLDSQGLDHSILDSLGSNILKSILVVDVEPGLISVYRNENEATELMSFLKKNGFWISNLEVKGSQRLSKTVQNMLLNQKRRKYDYIATKKVLKFFHKTSPGWFGITYLNDFSNFEGFSKRDYLAISLFGILQKQYGFVIEVCTKAKHLMDDDLFNEIITYCFKKLHPIKLNITISIVEKLIRFYKLVK